MAPSKIQIYHVTQKNFSIQGSFFVCEILSRAFRLFSTTTCTSEAIFIIAEDDMVQIIPVILTPLVSRESFDNYCHLHCISGCLRSIALNHSE